MLNEADWVQYGWFAWSLCRCRAPCAVRNARLPPFEVSDTVALHRRSCAAVLLRHVSQAETGASETYDEHIGVGFE